MREQCNCNKQHLLLSRIEQLEDAVALAEAKCQAIEEKLAQQVRDNGRMRRSLGSLKSSVRRSGGQ
jgi:uncharacterized coiled-coil protein SlyX